MAAIQWLALVGDSSVISGDRYEYWHVDAPSGSEDTTVASHGGRLLGMAEPPDNAGDAVYAWGHVVN